MSDEVLNVVPAEPATAPTVKITVRPNGPFRVEGPDRPGRCEWEGVGFDREAGDFALPLRDVVEAAVLRWDAWQRRMEVRGQSDSDGAGCAGIGLRCRSHNDSLTTSVWSRHLDFDFTFI